MKLCDAADGHTCSPGNCETVHETRSSEHRDATQIRGAVARLCIAQSKHGRRGTQNTTKAYAHTHACTSAESRVQLVRSGDKPGCCHTPLLIKIIHTALHTPADDLPTPGSRRFVRTRCSQRLFVDFSKLLPVTPGSTRSHEMVLNDV